MLIRGSTTRAVECFTLVKPRPEGPVLGFYRDQPIATAMIDAFGRRYAYAGVASRLRSGSYDLDSLGADEWLVEPGLVYVGQVPGEGGLLRKLLGAERSRRS